MRRILIYLVSGLALVFVLLAGAWWYVAHNVETPKYTVERADGAIELRAYPALIAASVTRDGPRWEAVRQGFRPLAGYIFARERAGESIAMTAPVTQRADAPGGGWSVQFIMPSKYTRDDLPAPAQGDVILTDIPARTRAAIRFSGVATDELIAKQQAILETWMAKEGLIPDGPPIYAYYNDPWTPGFLRRNEVLFDLTPG